MATKYGPARSGDPKGRSFRGTDEPLKDDETRLKPYERLSRGTKQSMDLDQREKAAKLDKEADGYDRADAVYNIVSAPSRAAFKVITGRDTPNQDRSTDRRKKAQAERDWKPSPNTKYGDTTPEKYASGGSVRGYGAARGAKNCKGS